MSAPNQHTTRVSKTRLRQLQRDAQGLQDAQEKAGQDILVFIHKVKEEGLSNAAVAGMFGISASGIPAKATAGAAIKAERARRGRGALASDG